MKFFAKSLLMAALLLLPMVSNAQIQVTPGNSLPTGWTADSLVSNVLLGEGVIVANVTFNGQPGALNCNNIGKFITGSTATNLGISSGIILSTGGVQGAVGPNNIGSHSETSTCSSYTNAALAAIASGTLNDCMVLEFDFVPRSDSVKFNYVFASEEYPEFAGSQFNDAFAFFLSGINPNGGMYNNFNIARLPDSVTTITINNINASTNSQYYITNNGSFIQFDAFTTVLTAQAKVQPCTPYHLVMAVADVSDNAYDTGVFLEAGSLRSNPIEFNFNNAANPVEPSDVYEGCCVSIDMERAYPLSTPTQINMTFEGTAGNGADFTSLNPFIFFPADSTHISLTICPNRDSIPESTETFKIVMSPANGCPRSDSVQFNILDTEPITIEVSHDTIHATSTRCRLMAHVEGGMPIHEVTWTRLSNNQTLVGDTVTVNVFNDTATYRVDVNDNCYSYAQTQIFVPIVRNPATIRSDTTICEGEPLTIYPIIRLHKVPDTLIENGDTTIIVRDSCVYYANGVPFSFGPDTIVVTPDTTTVYRMKTYLFKYGQWWEDVDSVRVVVIPAPQVQATASSYEICEGESVTISATGTPTFSWDGGENYVTATSHVYQPDSTMDFIIFGKTTAAECFGRDTVHILVDTMPVITIDNNSTQGVCDGAEAHIYVSLGAENFSWSASPADPTLGGQEHNTSLLVNPLKTTTYTISASTGVCHTSNSHTIHVEQTPVAIGEVDPTTVSLGNMEATFTDVSQYATTRRWDLPDGSTSEEPSVKIVVPNDVDSLNVRLTAFNPYLCFDTVTLTVFVDHTTLWAPNAFTPDEGTNNTFAVKMNDVSHYHIFIYDRRGQLVFESYDPEEEWDGTGQNGQKCPQGAYVYLISCHKITAPYDQIVQRGTVLLIR